MTPYLEIILNNKIYTQRTPNSKFIEFNLDGTKQNTYNELPNDIKAIADDMISCEENPELYFEYMEFDNKIVITSIYNVDIEHVKIPEFIDGLPVVDLDYSIIPPDSKIKQIQLPETLEFFSERTFMNAKILNYINMPSKIKVIPRDCFSRCENINGINLSNIEEIEENAFINCKSIKSIDLPNIEYIGMCAFEGCTSLKTAKLSDKLKDIEAATFKSCIGLEEIKLSNVLESLEGNVFENCFKLNKINLPDTLHHIGLYCFYHCENLKEISFPKNLQYIGKYAFSRSGLETIEFNSKIKKICEFVFYNCPNISKLKMSDAAYFPLSIFGTTFIDKIELTNKPVQEKNEKGDEER